jgi:hypothetical protein
MIFYAEIRSTHSSDVGQRSARQAALDALLAEGKVIRIDKEYFANDPSGSVEQLIHAEAVRLDA